jgi:hypothetical protein
MAILDDLQYCKSSKSWVCGPKKVKKHDDVILEWSLTKTCTMRRYMCLGKTSYSSFFIRERPLLTSDIRVGRGRGAKIAPKIERYRVG